MATAIPATRRGRPRKFGEPARVVAVTLPEGVIAALRAIDEDLGRAIVRLVQPRLGEVPHPPAEVSAFGNRAVILVPPSVTLRDRTGIEFVPLSDGRALISFAPRLTIEAIELRVTEALADATLPARERAMFEALADILGDARRSGRIALRERSIIVLHRKRDRRGAAARQAVAKATPRKRG